MDEKDVKILNAILKSKPPFKVLEISRQTGIPESTIRYRLRNYELSPIFDFESLGYYLILKDSSDEGCINMMKLNDGRSLFVCLSEVLDGGLLLQRIIKTAVSARKDETGYKILYPEKTVQMDEVCYDILRSYKKNVFVTRKEIAETHNYTVQTVKYHLDNHLSEIFVSYHIREKQDKEHSKILLEIYHDYNDKIIGSVMNLPGTEEAYISTGGPLFVKMRVRKLNQLKDLSRKLYEAGYPNKVSFIIEEEERLPSYDFFISSISARNR